MSTASHQPVQVRLEEPEDVAAIRRVNELAFPGGGEAALVDALRVARVVTLSMVAVVDADVIGGDEAGTSEPGATVATWGGEGTGWGAEEAPARGTAAAGATGPGRGDRVVGGEVIGHALVTPVTVATGHGEVPLLGLGPVAVLPAEQGRGAGTVLIEACLERLRESGHAGIVVAGDPGYYSRFGFIPASRWGLHWETEVPDEVFMALELSPGLLGGTTGVVRYRPEFTEFVDQEPAAPEAREDRHP